jgi:2-methylcitrate dehydratase PrpD
MRSDVTRALVEAVRSLRWSDVPEDVREVSRHCLLDFLGVAISGAREPLVDVLVSEVVRGEAGDEASLIGRGERGTRLSAALVNGAAGHALDFDDTHTTMNGHPSVPVLPALLALAEGEDGDGERLLSALVAGIELECRLGLLLGGGHYAAGFHSTGTLGTFGAAAACAHWLDLDEAGWCNTLGLAGTQAAGLKSGFGTMAKPLHAGRAASAGLLAAILARGGFTGQPAIVEVAQGFAATHAGRSQTDTSAIDRSVGHFFTRETLFKYHAACYLTHAAIESAGALREEHGIDPEKVESVEVQVSPALLSVCNIQEPTTGLEGKFSLRATTALALLGADTGALSTYSDRQMSDPGLIALRDRVRVTPTEGMSPTGARVKLEVSSRRLEGEADTGTPAADLALQRARLTRKFASLVEPALGAGRADSLSQAALGADGLTSVRELVALAHA